MPAFLLCPDDGVTDYVSDGSVGRSPLSGLGVGAGRATSPSVFFLSLASDQTAIVTASSLAFAMEINDSPI
ncbi:MAG: hypothetical protein OEU92_11205 [Alphaproteobacteria bacterium]|nr:hypothetical protein [Alphaproteobacteria bacterium]